MPTLTDQQRKDLDLARQINREARANPRSPYVGKYVGILRQQVIAVEDTLDALDARFDALGLDHREGVCIEASADYDIGYRI